MLRITLALAAATVVAVVPAHAQTTVTTLQGTVGPGYTISLKQGGRAVSRLAPGMYRIVVDDRSPMHNFVVEQSGGGTERAITTVPFVGTKSITLRLTRGQWEFYCAPHQANMKGHFGVGVAPKEAGDDNGGGKG